MKNSTIEVLEEIRNGGYHTITSDDDEELFKTIQRLRGFGVLHKPQKSIVLAPNQMRYLSIAIKSKSIDAVQKAIENDLKPPKKKNWLQRIYDHPFRKIIGSISLVLLGVILTFILERYFKN